MATSLLGFNVPDGVVIVEAQNVLDYWTENTAYSGEPWDKWPPGLTPPWPLSHVEFEWDGNECAVACLCERMDWGHILYMMAISLSVPTTPETDLCACIDGGGNLATVFGVRRGWRVEDGVDSCEPDIIVSAYEDDFAQNLSAMGSIALLTFLFANCRNVTVRDETPGLTRQQRRHGPPAITHKVLDIAPMTRVLRDKGDIEHNGLKKALHICRGHFSHYTSEAPLFGKYEGTFWTPMHLRGSASQGAVVKDYNVLPNEIER